MRHTLSALLLTATVASGATVNFATLTNYAGHAYPTTAIVQVFYTNMPVAAASGLVTPGAPIRFPVNTQTNLQAGNYEFALAGVTFASRVRFVVPDDTNTYTIGQLVSNVAAAPVGPPFVLSVVAGTNTYVGTTNGVSTIHSTATGTGGTATNVINIAAGTGVTIVTNSSTLVTISATSGVLQYDDPDEEGVLQFDE